MAATLDFCTDNGGIRMFFFSDHIPQPNLGRVESQFLGGQVHKPLHGQHSNRQSHPAVHPNSGFIGGNRHGLEAEGRGLIRSGHTGSGVSGFKRRPPGVLGIRAHIADKPASDAEDGSVLPDGKLGLDRLLFGVERGG